jgi:hypothetical protein
MSKLPAFHKARLETFGFRFYTPKETKAFGLDLDPGDFVFSHQDIYIWVFGWSPEPAPPAPEELRASYRDGKVYLSHAGRDLSADVGNIPMLSLIMAETYEAF